MRIFAGCQRDGRTACQTRRKNKVSTFQSVPSAINCAANYFTQTRSNSLGELVKGWWKKSMIGITVALNEWKRISFILVGVVLRKLLWEGGGGGWVLGVDAVQSIGALSDVAFWMGIIRPLSDWIPSQSPLFVWPTVERFPEWLSSSGIGCLRSSKGDEQVSSFYQGKCLVGILTMSVDAWNKSQSIDKCQSQLEDHLVSEVTEVRCQLSRNVEMWLMLQVWIVSFLPISEKPPIKNSVRCLLI